MPTENAPSRSRGAAAAGQPLRVSGWRMHVPGQPLQLDHWEVTAGADQVVVEVAGCGVCHTDLGFYYEGIPTRHPLPLALGHEISGTVVAAGQGARDWVGRPVVVPAVIPCGECPVCKAQHSAICPHQIFPGNDADGGFASHVVVPCRGLCSVPDLAEPAINPHRLALADLSVIADAVTTPYQALLKADLAADDLAVFVGIGGVGGFGVQLAAAFGAHVAAIDVDAERLATLAGHGAALTLDASQRPFKELKQEVKRFARQHEIPTYRWRIFETSGTPQGQQTAFGLLAHGAHLGIVGYTAERVAVRLSNLMAFDATAAGNWGCPPEHYPAVLDLVLSGSVSLAPFVEHRSLSSINQSFSDLHERRVRKRLVLLPEREGCA